MFNRILGNYLVEKNRITKAQLAEVLEKQNSVRVKLGVIAVSEKLMTKEQADEVNHLQSVTDKRFGDIAVEKGYLTEEQVLRLLRKQGNACLYFIQALIDLEYMTLEDIDSEIDAYQVDNGLTQSDMDDLTSEDIDRIVNVFLPEPGELYGRLGGVAVRTLIRLIDAGACIGKGVLKSSISADNFALQKCEGDHSVYTGFAGKGDALLSIAEVFGQEEFGSVNLDALDAVGEFINCVNGLFASALSTEHVSVDMLPPEFYDRPVQIEGDYFCEIPVTVLGREVILITATDSELQIKQKEA